AVDKADCPRRRHLARLEVAVRLSRPADRHGQPAGRPRRRAGQLPPHLGNGVNVFFVPQMGTMIYTMTRMATRLNLEADKPGVYEGISAHFSGDGFPGMRFAVHAVPPAEFAAWAASAHSGPA